ncbi:group 2 glycosyl transferase [Mycolicibacterium canariasense]|uniref:Group 2 glycosyl transferase n=1 Tax=Mycolicibacterium canariasense TaxID=228230 RepID=A0A100WJL6_MYCCR|nr:group 2 glycosyl transferase [Mycolicibacterium canariasense]
MQLDDRMSFVIATRDRGDELEAVVQRLLDTTRCPIVVVDNHSRDDSVARIRRIAAGEPRVQVLALGANLGAVARNIGVTNSRTPYIAFCDDDSWWATDAPGRAVELFDRHADLALLAARTVVWPGGDEDPMVAHLAGSPLPSRADLPGPTILGFMACAAMVRKSAFEAAGGFSPILHFRGEEQLLAMDLAASGWQLCYCPELTAFHQPSQLREPTAAQQARVLRNTALTSWLRRPVGHGLRSAVILFGSAIRDPAHLRAAGQAVRLLPSVLRERRRLPAAVEHQLAVLEHPHPDDTFVRDRGRPNPTGQSRS